MSNTEPEPPHLFVTLRFSIPEVRKLPEPLATNIAYCSAKAQMLEHAVKSAITKDIHVFAKASDQISFQEILEKITLDGRRIIAVGTSLLSFMELLST